MAYARPGTAVPGTSAGGLRAYGARAQPAEGSVTAAVYGLIRDVRYADAARVLTLQLQSFPRSRAALSLLAYCYYQMQDYRAAAQVCSAERAVRICVCRSVTSIHVPPSRRLTRSSSRSTRTSRRTACTWRSRFTRRGCIPRRSARRRRATTSAAARTPPSHSASRSCRLVPSAPPPLLYCGPCGAAVDARGAGRVRARNAGVMAG